MPAYKGSPGGGGGSGGLTLGPPTNEFTAATKAAAETLRNTYATANATWLADYDDEPTYTITINWPATPTNTVFQARRSSSWADVTGLVRGPKGIAGDQARFVLYAYINSATAPAAAPTGGTFVQSTGTLTVPTGYTSVPSTPASGSKTYRTAAVVNPANDSDTVTLVWSVPAELPAYLAAALAEAAQTAAETARDLAQQYAGQAQDIPAGSPRGVLVATSPTLPTGSVGSNTVIAFGAAELWTLGANAPDGYEAGPTASNERLYLPDIHPAGSNGMFVVIEVGGVEIAEVFISQGGIQGATGADRRHILPVSLTADALVRVGFWPRSGATASYIQITGNSDTLPVDTVVKVYLAVVRGAGGAGGGGGGTTEARVQELIDATSLSALQGQVTDAQVPDTFFRDSELTAAAVRTLLGLTATEANDLLTGATISGQVITFTQNDGTTATITVPAGTGGMADGVVESGVFSANNEELVLTLDTGGTVTIDVPAALRASGGTITAQDEGVELATDITTINVVGDGAAGTAAGGVLTITVGAEPDPTHTSYCGVSDDTTITETEATDGTTGVGNALVVPTYTGTMHVFFLRPTSEGAITAVYIYDDGSPNTQNQISAWTAFNLDVGGVAHDGVYSVGLTSASGLIVEVV